eukprot:scaffold215818_cov33-Cyclotella_meneghiniana.AAC.1
MAITSHHRRHAGKRYFGQTLAAHTATASGLSDASLSYAVDARETIVFFESLFIVITVITAITRGTPLLPFKPPSENARIATITVDTLHAAYISHSGAGSTLRATNH